MARAQAGASLRRRRPHLEEAEQERLGILLPATLTLLGLIIGFSFSMAVSRYGQRENFEEAEANAIGMEYVRASLLPSTDATRVRELLRSYLEQRVLFYTTRNARRLEQINAVTAQLQAEVWSGILAPAAAQPTPVVALAVSGMNDMLNSQGYTQAVWSNRIPFSAWGLMAAIALSCSLLVGYHTRLTEAKSLRSFLLPLLVAIAFFLIADLNSSRRGVIRVRPQNLMSLARSLHTQ